MRSRLDIIFIDAAVRTNVFCSDAKSIGIGNRALKLIFRRKKAPEEFIVESFKETTVVLSTNNGPLEVPKYKLPLELQPGDVLILNEFDIYERK